MVKLSPGINFINVLRTAFMHADPKSLKKKVKLSIFLVLLGSAHTKAGRRTLVKSTLGLFLILGFLTNCLNTYGFVVQLTKNRIPGDRCHSRYDGQN
jgi:hypothetical protein